MEETSLHSLSVAASIKSGSTFWPDNWSVKPSSSDVSLEDFAELPFEAISQYPAEAVGFSSMQLILSRCASRTHVTTIGRLQSFKSGSVPMLNAL